MNAATRSVRRPAVPKKTPAKMEELVVELPEAAVLTVKDGRVNMSLPAAQMESWLEDELDILVSRARLAAERHLAIPIEEAFARIDSGQYRGEE